MAPKKGKKVNPVSGVAAIEEKQGLNIRDNASRCGNDVQLDGYKKEEEACNASPNKISCCSSKGNDTEGKNQVDLPVVQSPQPEKTPPRMPPNASTLVLASTSAICLGCGDDCPCCIENGWSYCQCGPNCTCSNPLLAEQASLVLESAGKIPSQPEPLSSGPAEDPFQSPGTLFPDLEANQREGHPLFVDIVVGGMTCTICSQAITRAISGMEGIQSVTVSLATDIAHIEIDTRKEREYASVVEEVQEMISDIGYTVVDVITMPDKIHPSAGKTTTTDHYDESTALLGNSRNRNNTQQDHWNRIALRQEEKLQHRKSAFLWSLMGTIPILLFTMVLPYVLPSTNGWWDRQHVNLFHRAVPLESLLLWILATPVQFICGWEFYKSSYYGLFRTGTMGMDFLVVLGTTSSYGYALYATFSDRIHESHFFETSAVLICFVLLGKWMQALAVHRTSDALSQLMQLQPTTAIRVTPISGKPGGPWDPMRDAYREEIIETTDLERGDIVKIVPGASLPADGVVLCGELSVDESMVTGESLPVLKTKLSAVLGGTLCVESSVLDEKARSGGDEHPYGDTTRAGQVAFCEVTGVGSSTALAQIIQLVQDAQASKVPMMNFADSVSSVFVPVVATLSIVTFLVWYALCSTGVVPEEWYTSMNEDAATFSLMFGIACLVISCPCALGLATPTAVMVGTGIGAKLGILMKGGESLEAASKVNAVVLDKTGTVTTGKPAVTDFLLLKDSAKATRNGCCSKKKTAPHLDDVKPLSMESILWLVGSLERSSEHPLAKAIVAYAEHELSRTKNGRSYLEERPFLQPSEFRSITGRGASGYMTQDGNALNRYFVAVGNRALFALLEIELTMDIDSQMKELEDQGKTAVLVAINHEFYVIMGVADELKPDAAATVAYLIDQMKCEVWLVTGDNKTTASAIARQLGIPPQRVVSEALPNAKVHQVKKLQMQGKIVAHVGDGINDSPALAQADVGISMGTGAAIAAEASDMVLIRGHYVADVCTALDLCRVIFTRIKWNFLWSLVYNCLGIPLAAGVFFPIFHTRLPPTVAALAMALSSISVVFSSLALRLYRPPAIGTIAARTAAMRGHSLETVPPKANERGPQLVTTLSLELGGGSSSELAHPLLVKQQQHNSGVEERPQF